MTKKVQRRVEGAKVAGGPGFIRWYVGDALVREVTTAAYYRNGHIHPADCTCDALVHDEEFQADLVRDLQAARDHA